MYVHKLVIVGILFLLISSVAINSNAQQNNSTLENYVLVFNGTNQYINIKNDESLQLNDFTILIRFNPKQFNETRRGIIQKSGPLNEFAINIHNDSSIDFYWGNGTNHNKGWKFIPSNTILFNEWQTIVLQRQGKTSRGFLNGNLVAEYNYSINPYVGVNELLIGKTHAGYFKGYIDFVKIYNKALVFEEIKEDFNNNSLEENLVSLWNFNEPFGSIAIDSINNNHGQIINDPVRISEDRLNEFEPPNIEWLKSYNINEKDIIYKIIQTSDGGFAAAGQTYQDQVGFNFWFLKINPNGSISMDKGIGRDLEVNYLLNEKAYDVIESDGGYVLIGETTSSFGDDSNILLVKIDTDGNFLWHKEFGGAGNDVGLSLIKQGDGFAFTGWSESYEGKSREAFIIRTDFDGEIQWSQNYGNEGDEMGYAITKTSDGGFAVAGEKIQEKDIFLYLLKTNNTGDLSWSKTYQKIAHDSVYGVLETNDSGLAVLSDTYGVYDISILKTDSNGNSLWKKTYGGKEEDSGKYLAQSEDNGFIIGGYTKTLPDYDLFLIKTNYEGFVEWKHSCGSSIDDFIFSVAKTSDEGFAAIGIGKAINQNRLNLFKLTKPVQINITNTYPHADIGDKFITIKPGESIEFDTISTDFEGMLIYRWDFNGDGVIDSSSDSKQIYTYEKPGNYNAFLYVEDEKGFIDFDVKKVIVEQNSRSSLSKESLVLIYCFVIAIFSLIFIFFDHKKNLRKLLAKRFRFFKKINNWTWYLIISFFIILSFKFVIGFLIQNPIIYSDEHTYGYMASEVALGNLKFLGTIPSYFKITSSIPIGYSYILSLAHILGNNMNVIYQGMHLINCLLTTLIVFPVYLIMKRYVDRKTAFFTAIIITTSTAIMTYNYLLMTENAFYIAFIVSCYLLIKTFSIDTFNKKFLFYCLLTGISVGILIFLRITGIVMFPALIITIIYKILKERKISSLKYGISILPFLPAFIYIILNESSNPLGYQRSPFYFFDVIANIFSNNDSLANFFTWIFNEINYINLMGYIVFLAFSIFLLIFIRKLEIEKKKTLEPFVIYSLFSTLFLIIITSLSFNKYLDVIYTRYVSPGLLIIIMLGIIGIILYKKIRTKKIDFIVAAIFLILSIFLFTFPTNTSPKLLNIDLLWIENTSKSNLIGIDNFTVIRVILILIPILIYYISTRNSMYEKNKKNNRIKKVIKRDNLKRVFARPGHILISCVLIISLLLNISILGYEINESNDLDNYGINKPSQYINSIDPDAVVILDDHNTAYQGNGMRSLYWRYLWIGLNFWNPKGVIKHPLNPDDIQQLILIFELKNENIDADYFLSTHELTDYFEKIETFHLKLDSDSLNRYNMRDWHLYKV